MLIAFRDQSTVNTAHLLEILPMDEGDGVFKLYFFFCGDDKESTWRFATKEERDRVYAEVKKQINAYYIP